MEIADATTQQDCYMTISKIESLIEASDIRHSIKQETHKEFTMLYQFMRIALIALIVSLFHGCSDSGSKLIKVDGSSTVFPITAAAAEDYQKENREFRVTVGISGTGGGFKKFGRGETDISDASRPIKPTEVDLCSKNGIEYIELPVAYDGLAVIVHPQNDWVDYFTVDELKTLWEPDAQGKVTHWNQIRPEWPDKKFSLAGPGVDSGTYDYFTKAINGAEGASRGDYVASENDNILVQAVSNDLQGIGFFGLAYYEENKDVLRLVPIDDGNVENGNGPITPSLETVKNSTYQPLSRPMFIYVSKKSAERPEVARFIEFYLTHANALTKEVGYIPLPEEAYRLAMERFQNRVTGSVFGGKGAKTGVSVQELLGQGSE